MNLRLGGGRRLTISAVRRSRSARFVWFAWPTGFQFGIGSPGRHAPWAFIVFVSAWSAKGPRPADRRA